MLVNVAGEGRTFSSLVQSWEVASGPVNYPHPEHTGNADPTQGHRQKVSLKVGKLGTGLLGRKGGAQQE